ncbi:MAG: hypothetical protein M3Q81_01880 [bacterium]|nr:hypothetical protein [bacterium]
MRLFKEGAPASESNPDDVANEEVLAAEDFDAASFFSAVNADEATTLLTQLHTQSEETVALFSRNVTAETFAAGAQLSSGFLSALTAIAGACGPLCLHGIGAAASMGGGAAGLNGSLGGANMLGGNGSNPTYQALENLFSKKGISSQDIASGKVSLDELWALLSESLGQGVYMAFGFGFVESLLDTIIPTPQAA